MAHGEGIGGRMPWKPAHENHAIERVALSVILNEPISTKPFQSILNSATVALRDAGFESINDMPGFPGLQLGAPGPQLVQQIVIGPNGFIDSTNSAVEPQGRFFRLVQNGQVREEVRIQRNMFVFISTVYDGWKDFCARAEQHLKPHVASALQSVNVHILKLEYWDRFFYDGAAEEANFQELIQKNSKHVSHHSLSEKSIWHSYTGYFAKSDRKTQRLINLNVDAVDFPAPSPNQGEPRRSVGIYSMAQDAISGDAGSLDFDSSIAILDDMHGLLKAIVADVIVPEMADRISLNGPVSQ